MLYKLYDNLNGLFCRRGVKEKDESNEDRRFAIITKLIDAKNHPERYPDGCFCEQTLCTNVPLIKVVYRQEVIFFPLLSAACFYWLRETAKLYKQFSSDSDSLSAQDYIAFGLSNNSDKAIIFITGSFLLSMVAAGLMLDAKAKRRQSQIARIRTILDKDEISFLEMELNTASSSSYYYKLRANTSAELALDLLADVDLYDKSLEQPSQSYSSNYTVTI